MTQNFSVHETGGQQLQLWDSHGAFEQSAMDQFGKTARMPIIAGPVAGMPDVHAGYGPPVGSVIPTEHAIIPYAVGVDIGCGMVAVRTTLTANDLPSNLKPLYDEITRSVPHGRTNDGKAQDKGSWNSAPIPAAVASAWNATLDARFEAILAKHPQIGRNNAQTHLCSLGGGNHFIEVCLDQEDRVWAMLHSGSRGVGNRIGQHFIRIAKDSMGKSHQQSRMPEDPNLAYLTDDQQAFHDYVEAMTWAQDFAMLNRQLMLDRVLASMRKVLRPKFQTDKQAVNCHHNYASREVHGGRNLWITRKGAVNADKGRLGIIPGSMGAKSYIVEGLGNPASYNSCSHGAGRVMSRTAAKDNITLPMHRKAVEGIMCRVDKAVLDESPAAYKNIDAVMAAQSDLVRPLHTLRQILNVKG